LDFCMLCVLFPFLLKDDMTRRGLTNSTLFWTISLIPFFGALTYLVLRPPTIEQGQATSTPAQQISV
jgi:hypothetical protein